MDEQHVACEPKSCGVPLHPNLLVHLCSRIYQEVPLPVEKCLTVGRQQIVGWEVEMSALSCSLG